MLMKNVIVPYLLQVTGAASHTDQQVRLSPSASNPETRARRNNDSAAMHTLNTVPHQYI